MARQRTWTDEQLIESVRLCSSVAAVIRDMKSKIPGAGAGYWTIYQSVKRLWLDTSHWTGSGHMRGKTQNWNRRCDLSSVLVSESTYVNTRCLKNRLLKEHLMEYRCLVCGVSEWRGGKLTLQLDHINGHHFDNRIENLRLLCPNCHSQTSTYAGKNKKQPR